MGCDRLHDGQDVRATVGSDGKARTIVRESVRRTRQATRGPGSRESDRHRMGGLAQPRRSDARCLDKQVPVGKVNSIADIFEDEHFQARGNLARVEADGLGNVVVPGVLPTLSETPGRITNLGPPLGNATYEVMRDLLGISAHDIDNMRKQKII